MSSSLPWYKEGLKFECTGCGQCCTGEPGYVWITEEEIIHMAEYLKTSVEDFTKKYVRKVGKKLSLKELSPSNDCVFLNQNKCTIYPVRPKQCQTFPFWVSILKSKKDWDEAAKRCEGISEKAPLISFQEIENRKNSA